MTHTSVIAKPWSLARRQPPSRTPVDGAELRIAVIEGDRLEAHWVCALTLGLRRGEPLGLTWADDDMGAGSVAVRQTVIRAGGQLHIARPKTARSRRVVPAPLVTIDRLRAHRAAQVGSQETAGARWRATVGTPIEPRNLDRAWHLVRDRADLDWLRLHDLRHACATFMLEAGASPRTVMKMLGHSRIALAMNTYAHVLPEMEREAVDDVAGRLFD